MAERLKAAVLKTVRVGRPSGVRIPLPPPLQVAENGNRRLTAVAGLCLHTSRGLMRMLGKSDAQWREYLFY